MQKPEYCSQIDNRQNHKNNSLVLQNAERSSMVFQIMQLENSRNQYDVTLDLSGDAQPDFLSIDPEVSESPYKN